MGRGFESLLAHLYGLFLSVWWVWHSWLARRIVVPKVEGSNPSTHPVAVATQYTLGYRQAVRHQILILAFAGSNPASPVSDLCLFLLARYRLVIEYGVVAQLVEHLTFNQVVGSSSLLSLSKGKHVSIGLRAFLFYNMIKDILDFYVYKLKVKK